MQSTYICICLRCESGLKFLDVGMHPGHLHNILKAGECTYVEGSIKNGSFPLQNILYLFQKWGLSPYNGMLQIIRCQLGRIKRRMFDIAAFFTWICFSQGDPFQLTHYGLFSMILGGLWRSAFITLVQSKYLWKECVEFCGGSKNVYFAMECDHMQKLPYLFVTISRIYLLWFYS